MSNGQQLVYLGEDICANVPGLMNGEFLRGMPRKMSGQGRESSDLTMRMFPDFQIVNSDAYYIGASNTIDDFSLIAEAAPAGSSVLVMRDMGLGDIVLALPALAELKRRLPGVHVTFATLPQYVKLAADTGVVDDVVSIVGVDVSSGKYGLVINWCRCLELYAIKRNCGRRVESYAKMLGMTLDAGNMVIKPVVSDADNAAADGLLAGHDGPFIGYVMRAASWNRSYPVWRAREVVVEIARRFPDHKVIALDVADLKMLSSVPGVIDLCGKTKSAMEAAAVMQRCDMVISPDTGLAHISAALGIKTLVLLSSMPFEWRYDHYGPHVHGFMKCAGPCVPCWDWQRAPKQFTFCSRTKDNICLSSIDPSEVAEKAMEAFYQ